MRTSCSKHAGDPDHSVQIHHTNRTRAYPLPTYICIVGFKYEIRGDYPYFLTHTIVDWIDIFTRRELADVVVDSLDHCIRQKDLELYAWCLMPSHLHMIARSPTSDERELSNIMRDFKKFTSGEIIRTIGRIGESRREWLLKHFKFIN